MPAGFAQRKSNVREQAKLYRPHLPQAAVKILNSYRSLASWSEQNTSVFPSGENSGKLVKPPKVVTCSRPVPSRLTRYNSNFRLSHSCLLEANRIFFPSGVNVGAKLAQPKFVMACAL